MSNPAKWYYMAKRLGAENSSKGSELSVECLNGLTNEQSVEEVAAFFIRVSQEYSPLNTAKLPAYLPATVVLGFRNFRYDF